MLAFGVSGCKEQLQVLTDAMAKAGQDNAQQAAAKKSAQPQQSTGLTKQDLDKSLRAAIDEKSRPIKYAGAGVAKTCGSKFYMVTATHDGTRVSIKAKDVNKKTQYRGTLRLVDPNTSPEFTNKKNLAKMGKQKSTGHYVLHGTVYDGKCPITYVLKREDKRYTSIE
jgi:hypothetical protein